jgi:hypothetical protein
VCFDLGNILFEGKCEDDFKLLCFLKHIRPNEWMSG